jgi:ribosomal protein S27E
VRGAAWLTDNKHGRQVRSLICTSCERRPVVVGHSTVDLYCVICRRYRRQHR